MRVSLKSLLMKKLSEISINLKYLSRPCSRSKHFRKRLVDYSSVIDSEPEVILST